ncbi:hypothetical protein HMPREF9372_1185 [Sporosarcina newyorkensis 2681]|uniref:Uncharacterized protein n=1 Tax=Sporosarcina newyorkensis 2681 TaxID=1027292 RepID=F9DQV5_9BACL|nr:hypothetical protein [Sporosarcina newyorkensis]EGQ26794.1 hypothetical protein HMPREF9372_1185 [Sporosarcina newyorkensis 2681]
MWDLIKKVLLPREHEEFSELMKRATDLAAQDSKWNHFKGKSFLFSSSSRHDDFSERMEELERQQFEGLEIHQTHMDMHDPYINPGVSIVVDEPYHGIDHGTNYGADSDFTHSSGHDGF